MSAISDDVREAPEEGARTGSDLIADAAAGRKLEQEETGDALDWLLSEEQQVPTKRLRLNLGGGETPDGEPIPDRWVYWKVQAVDEGVIRRIMREAAQASGAAPTNRQGRRRGGAQGGTHSDDANLRMVVAATVEPDLALAAQKSGIADPHTLVKQRFRYKAGILGNLADAVMELSGFSDEDVQDAREVRAAGN